MAKLLERADGDRGTTMKIPQLQIFTSLETKMLLLIF